MLNVLVINNILDVENKVLICKEKIIKETLDKISKDKLKLSTLKDVLEKNILDDEDDKKWEEKLKIYDKLRLKLINNLELIKKDIILKVVNEIIECYFDYKLKKISEKKMYENIEIINEKIKENYTKYYSYKFAN